MVKKEESIRLAGELPLAELVVIPDCGHLPHEEQPEAFVLTVRNFVKRVMV
jgi:pimeloyl-ACP methyl ester carboxylesterase